MVNRLRKIIGQIFASWRENRSLWIVFLVALLLRWIFGLLWIYHQGADNLIAAGDGSKFMKLAYNLFNGYGFSLSASPPHIPDGFRTPGYPIFLIIASLGTLNSVAIIFVQGFIAAITAFLIFRIGREIIDERAGFWAALLYAIEPLAIFVTFQILTETFFTFLMVLSIYPFLTKGRRLSLWVISGLSAGAAALVKPAGICLIFLWSATALLFSKKKIIFPHLLIVVTISVLIIFPWAIRNNRRFGSLQLSSQGGSILDKTVRWYLQSKKNFSRGEAEALMAQYAKEDKNPYLLASEEGGDPRFGEFAVKQWLGILRRYPLSFSGYYLSTTIPFFFGDGYVSILAAINPEFKENVFIWKGRIADLPTAFFKLNSFGSAAVFAVSKILWIAIYIFALRGIIYFLKNPQKRFAGLIIILTICYFAILPGPINHSRYRQPVNPLIFLVAAAGFFSVRRKAEPLFFDKMDTKPSDGKKLSIIMPVYNEKNTILQILKKVDLADLGGVEKEIIIIDDCSSDGTRDILKGLEDKYKILYHEKNRGKGAALRTGFKEATGDWIVVQDADLEYDPNDLKKMLEKAKEDGVYVIYGSRRLHKNYWNERKSGHFFALGGIFLTWFTNLLYGTKITDEPTCYKMIKSDLLRDLNLKCERFEFCPEVTAKVAKRKIKIYEIPIEYFPRHKNEGKKINWRDAAEAIWTLIKYRFKN